MQYCMVEGPSIGSFKISTHIPTAPVINNQVAYTFSVFYPSLEYVGLQVDLFDLRSCQDSTSYKKLPILVVKAKLSSKSSLGFFLILTHHHQDFHSRNSECSLWDNHQYNISCLHIDSTLNLWYHDEMSFLLHLFLYQ